MADHRAQAAVLRCQRLLHVEHRRLQDGGGDVHAVVGKVVIQRGGLRQHVPATAGVGLADALHFLAVVPGRGDQDVAAETAAAHRLGREIEVVTRAADLDLDAVDFGTRFDLGLRIHPGVAFDRIAQRFLHAAGDGIGAFAIGVGQMTRHVFVGQHRTCGGVDRVQYLAPAFRRLILAAQQAAAELMIGLAPVFAEIRRHRIADVEAQIRLPLRRLQAADHFVELCEECCVGHRHLFGIHALCLEEGGELQVAVFLRKILGRHRAVTGVDAAQRFLGFRQARDPRFQIDHQLRFARHFVLRRARQRQDLLHVAVVAAQQRARVGVAARVERGIGQAHAALREIAEVGIEILQIDVSGEIEGYRDADLMQRRDRRRHVLRFLDRADTCEQGRDRRRAVAFYRRFVKAARPEIAEQLLDPVPRRIHRRIQQIALLLLRARRQLP